MDVYILANFRTSHLDSLGYLPNGNLRNNLLPMRIDSNTANLMRDSFGRVVFRVPLHATEQQQLWDTREVATGTYTVVIMNAGRELRTEKLIVKQ